MPLTSSIAYLLIPVFSDNYITRLDENTSVYSLYFLRISNRTFSCYEIASNRACKECIIMTDSGASQVATGTTKMLPFLFNADLTNWRLVINSTVLAMGRVLAPVYDL